MSNLEYYFNDYFKIRFTITRIVFFNYRRSGEVARMTKQQFENREVGGSSTNILNIKLSIVEKMISQHVEVVVLKGTPH